MEGRGGLHALDDRDAELLVVYRREFGRPDPCAAPLQTGQT